MDKYEFNIKVEQIKKLVNKGDYETAMKITDTVDWRRVRNVSILSMVATIYEKNEDYQEAKDILLLAFERAPIGKRLLYKLADLAIKEGNIGEAEDYYREFCDLAPDDPRQYLLRYMILGAKGAPPQQLIHTLEQYCNVELDEKWLYELATLYNEVGLSDLCVRTCDKIMLMFGLGKYVDKAMELKIQHAPLTKYQMDLEENRDKYEARLRAVEQGYEAPATAYDYDMPPAGRPVPVPLQRAETEAPQEPDPYDEEPVYGERQPYRPYRSTREEPAYQEEPAYAEEPGYAEGGFGEAGDEAYGGEAYQDDAYYGNEEAPYGEEEPYPEDGFGGAAYEEEPEEPYAGTPGYVPYGSEDEPAGGEPEVYEDEYAPEGDDAVQAENEPEQGAQGESAAEGTGWPAEEETLTQEALAARVHEAEVQASLARELSRLSGAEFSEESRQAQTRVLKDLRSLKSGDDADDYAPVAARVSNHLMIESEDPDEGLALAIDALKKVHRELGIKNQAAKITGEKLNQKGVLALADKLTGKDLIIEYAGDMSDEMLQELDLLMARDETGMNVVMIDNREQLEVIHRQYPGLAKRFECIGEAPALKAEARPEAAPAAKPVAAVKKVLQEPELPAEEADAPPRPVTPVRMPAAEPAAPAFKAPEPPMVEKAPVRPKVVKQEPVYEDEYQDQYEPGDYEEPYEDEGYDEPEEEDIPAPKAPRIPLRKVPEKAPASRIEDEPEEEYEDDGEEMDIDEFAQYACQYAGEIDCSISGKSMLALYERIEIMEEDGVPLTRANAEELIEEAADKAERPSLGKRVKGIFSSKYDKDGLLILKEEHFI
ncbi:MAG: hypothetical protein LUH04_18575 [Clostridium sp.]|nr:hypothetical protein [Clostridium sp.]